MIQELIGEKIVVDMRSSYVCLGTLLRADEMFLKLKNADLHDLRDANNARLRRRLQGDRNKTKPQARAAGPGRHHRRQPPRRLRG